MIIEGTEKRLAQKGVEILCETTEKILQEKEYAVIAVPGGRSVAAIYDIFRDSDLNWQRVQIFLLDDRLVPPDHKDSNYKLVAQHLGEKITKTSLHRFCYDAAYPENSIEGYKRELDLCGGRLDIVLASSGEDGHIGSLFPGHPVLEEDHDGFVLIHDSPKPPPGRMTAGLQLIQWAETGIVLFLGVTKRDSLLRFQHDDVTVPQCPAKVIASLPHYYVLTDQRV